jgi:hypothetical protein
MTPGGLRLLFRHHRLRGHIPRANPHRLRHYASSRAMPHRPTRSGCGPC